MKQNKTKNLVSYNKHHSHGQQFRSWPRFSWLMLSLVVALPWAIGWLELALSWGLDWGFPTYFPSFLDQRFIAMAEKQENKSNFTNSVGILYVNMPLAKALGQIQWHEVGSYISSVVGATASYMSVRVDIGRWINWKQWHNTLSYTGVLPLQLPFSKMLELWQWRWDRFMNHACRKLFFTT